MKYVKIKYLLIVFLATILFPLNVFAAEKVELKVDKNDLEIGDEITVSAKVSNYLDAYALLATLKYDENVFQRIDDSDFSVDDTSSVTYNEETNKFGIINKSGKISMGGGTLFTVHLKVKDDANVGDTNIALTNITYSDGNSKKTLDKTITKVSVTRDAKDGEAIPTNKENKINEDKEEVIVVFPTMKVIIALGIVAFILLIVIMYINSKEDEKKKSLYYLIAVEIIIILLIIILFLINFNKKDVNKDGKKDYKDAEEIIDYLIDIEGTKVKEDDKNTELNENNSSSNSSNSNGKNRRKSGNGGTSVRPSKDYDVNNDGKIDIEDAGHSTEDVTKKTKVTLKEVKSDKENYMQKGKVTLKFTADITPSDLKITKVKINDKYYDVEYNNGVYSVVIDDELIEAGKHDFVVKEVVLSNEEKRQTNLKITKEVLKDIPYVNKFNLNDEKKSLSFDLVDDDEAFIEGTVTIYDENKKIKEANVQTKGSTKIKDIKLEEDKTYIVEIIGRYDLDSKINDGKNNYDNQNMLTQTFMIGGNYNFTLTDEAITDAIQVGETPVVSFNSTNTRNATILTSNLTLEEEAKDYHITKIDGNNYEVALVGADTSPGKHTVTLNNVSLDSLKTFYNNKDYETKKLTYTVLKDAPKVENLNVTDNHNDKTITATFNFEDNYETTNKLTVVLVDSDGKIVNSKDIDKEELKKGNIEVSLSYKRNTKTSSAEGFYTVRVLADYDLSDNYKYTNKSLGEKDILTTTKDDIYISEMSLEKGNKYPTKNQKDYKLVFTVHVGDSIKAIAPAKYGTSRKYNKVHTITINGLNYTFNQNGNTSTDTDYKGTVTLTVPNDAGVLDIKANKVQLGISGYYNMTNTDMYSVEEQKVTIDVLKDQPKIENLTITDNYEEDKATFDFDVVLDPTESKEKFTEGKITLGSESKDIEAGHNNITLSNFDKDQNLDLIFNGSYDLDTDTIEEDSDKNETKNGELYRTKYGLYNKEIYDNISIENAEAISENDDNYFEKNEKIKLSFDIENIDPKLDATPEKVIIDDKEYVLTTTDDGYELILDGYNSSGEKELVLTDVILSNGKKVTLTDPYTFTPEVLKDIPIINDFTYEVLDDEIQVDFDLKNPDNSLIGKAKVIITDENGEVVYEDDYKDKIKFDKEKDVLRYYVKVVANYDRDIDTNKGSDNYEEGAILLDEVISLERNNIELKDITDINLYKEESSDGEDKIVLKDTVEIDDIEKNKSQYFVEIAMENLPTVRARIKNIVNDDEILTLVLDYEYVTKEGNKSQIIRIDYGSIEGNKVVNEFHPKNAFKVLLKELEEGKSVTLNRNYDASSIETPESTAYVMTAYEGTLDGNGYTIKNLAKPLFNNIKSGKVKSLNITDVTLDDNGKGALANEINDSEITGVLVDKVKTKSEASGGRGGLVGTANKSEIESCRATNITLSLNYLKQQNGTFIGVTNNTNINNCYATGTINSGWNYTSGFVGDSKSSTMTNNYVKVTFNGLTQTGAAFANSYSNNQSVYKNNIAFVTGPTTGFSGSAKEVKNNYIFTSSNISDVDGVNKITEEEIDDELFKTKAQFNDEIWNINNVSISDLPTFVEENKTELESVKGYDNNKDTLYKNLMKLMPFYDNDKIVESGNNINDSLLTNQVLIHIAPVDANGNLVTYLTTDNPKIINKIKVVFKNGVKQEYSVSYDKTYDMVATYKIDELGIDYNYNHYVINSDSQVVNNLTNYLKGLDYTNNLDTLTTNDDSRIYRDFYNETTKNELKDFVLKYLSNSNYTNTLDDDAINSYIEREVKKDKKIEKALYVYNYFRRFYDLDIEGMKLYDFVMFNMKGFDESLTSEKIIELYFGNSDGSNFNTNATGKVYKDLLSGYTNLTRISNFLEYVVTHFSNQDMDNWTRSQFKGILEEIPVEANKNIQYTLWDHFSNEDDEYSGDRYAVYNYVLPILTLPETAAYIISAPAQFTIGAQRVYMGNPTDPVELANFRAKMKVYTDRITSYYNTAYSIIQDEKIFNDIHLYQVDKRSTKDENGAGVYNYPNSTQEPFHKNFDEVVNVWPAEYGVNAGNWGDRIEWNVAGFMDSNIQNDGNIDSGHPTWATWSHETAHYLDDRLFLKDNDRRFNSGGEDYADEFLMQKFGLGVVMNLSINYNDNAEVATNLKPERINNKNKIYDFYSKMFESIYVVDYIEAQAFLKLTPEQKEQIGIQVNYPDYDTYKENTEKFYLAQLRSGFNQLNADQWKSMTLNNINDLIENKIMIYPGVYKFSSRGDNSYGGEGINIAHWYQPNNPSGRPDSYALKWLSYEMLGYKGYDNGFVEYASNINSKTYQNNGVTINNYKSDNMAIDKISGGVYKTIDEYKKARFKETGNNLKHLKYINVDKYAQELYDALVKDAKEMKEKVQNRLNRAGGEDNCLKDYWCYTPLFGEDRGYPNSTKVRKEIYFELKRKTNDFNENIYSNDINQTINFDIKTVE